MEFQKTLHEVIWNESTEIINGGRDRPGGVGYSAARIRGMAKTQERHMSNITMQSRHRHVPRSAAEPSTHGNGLAALLQKVCTPWHLN